MRLKAQKNEFYVYLHTKEDGTPFYVGKGKGKRAFQKYGRSSWWNRTFAKYGLDVIFLEENLPEEKAIESEIYWIKRIGRLDLKQGVLVNQTGGGDKGTTGRLNTEEYKEKMRKVNLGNKYNLGKTHSLETKAKISLSQKGRKTSKATKLKLRKAMLGEKNHMFGKKMSNEAIRKRSISRSGETRERIIVLDSETGVFYTSVRDASKYYDMKFSTLYNQLIGVNRNKTNLIIV